MDQYSIFKGTTHLLHEIPLNAIDPDPTRSVSLKDISFPTSYDLGPTSIVVPASPPVWTPQALPVELPSDTVPVDPRNILPSCPLDPMLRAVHLMSPDLALKEFGLISSRKNLRALFNFFKKGTANYRIDAEIVEGTLLFFLGWSGYGYGYSNTSYGMNFERKFTSALSEGIIQHNRVIAYSFGGLKMMVKYQVDACLDTGSRTAISTHSELKLSKSASMTPTGLKITSSGVMVPADTIIEIKTLPAGYRPDHPRTMTQLWFSQTPLLMAGYHDGRGRFLSTEEVNVEATGALEQWEKRNTTLLQKVIQLIEMIREHLASSPNKKQAIVLRGRALGRCVQFYGLADTYDIGLPNDLKERWL